MTSVQSFGLLKNHSIKMQTSAKLVLFIAICSFIYTISADSESASSESVDQDFGNSTENSNDTVPQDLYVIKTVVYEVGILTDANNDTDDLNKTHEQVDVSFFDPLLNGSALDFSNIPIPIQTNVSGVSVTGILPSHTNLSSILLPPGPSSQGSSPNPILPAKQVTVTQNISTTNPEKGSEIISNLPKLLGLTKNDTDKSDKDHESSGEKEA